MYGVTYSFNKEILLSNKFIPQKLFFYNTSIYWVASKISTSDKIQLKLIFIWFLWIYRKLYFKIKSKDNENISLFH